MATTNQIPEGSNGKPSWLVGGSVIGVILTSSCCLGPLLLITLGASGAWISNLSALKTYQPVFISVAVAFLALAYWQVYRPKPVDCDDKAYCAKPSSRWVLKGTLWIATVLLLVAVTTDYWAPLFY